MNTVHERLVAIEAQLRLYRRLALTIIVFGIGIGSVAMVQNKKYPDVIECKELRALKVRTDTAIAKKVSVRDRFELIGAKSKSAVVIEIVDGHGFVGVIDGVTGKDVSALSANDEGGQIHVQPRKGDGRSQWSWVDSESGYLRFMAGKKKGAEFGVSGDGGRAVVFDWQSNAAYLGWDKRGNGGLAVKDAEGHLGAGVAMNATGRGSMVIGDRGKARVRAFAESKGSGTVGVWNSKGHPAVLVIAGDTGAGEVVALKGDGGSDGQVLKYGK